MPKAILAVFGACVGAAGMLVARSRRTASSNTALWQDAVGRFGGDDPLGAGGDLTPPSTVQVNTRKRP